jgi:hypothetical protein
VRTWHLRDGKATEYWNATPDDQVEADEFWA